MLAQLRKTAYTIKHSTTLLLPRWYEILGEINHHTHIMPRDVTTRWNSAYNMLIFAIEYHKALDIITSEQNMKLRSYEPSPEEWDIATHLCDVLKVCCLLNLKLWAN